jgi:hypothetical protein
MSIYIYKQCPDDRARGSKGTSSCGSTTTTQQQFKEIAFWYRDMGTQISATANAWTYNNTMRGVYYSQWDFSGSLYADSDNSLCAFSPRIFRGDGAKGKHKFTPCGIACNCSGKRCCSEHLCCCKEKNPTTSVWVQMADWRFDTGVPSGTGQGQGPDYNSEVHWFFPQFGFTAGPSTSYCVSNPHCGIHDWCCWGTCGRDVVRGGWSYSGGAFSFTANGYWHSDAKYGCGYCWNATKPCPPGSSPTAVCCCNEGSHDIWARWQMTVTIRKGAKSSLRCGV